MAWIRQIGTLAHVSAGDDDEIWGITHGREVRRWNDGEWQPVPGQLKQLSVGSIDNIWGVNDEGQIFRWFGDWEEMPGRLTWVSAASDGTVVGVNVNDDIFRWNGGGWDQLGGKLVRVTVASRKVIYGYNRANHMFRWNGGGWDAHPGEARGAFSAGIRSGVTHLWAHIVSDQASGLVGEMSSLFLSVNNGPWQPTNSIMAQVSMSARYIVAVNPRGEVHSWEEALPTGVVPFVTRQRAWRWCAKCQGLFFGGHETKGHCPARSFKIAATQRVEHNSTGSGEYALASSAGAPGQTGWRWCRKCEGLFWPNSPGRCQMGDGHDGSQSGTYTLVHDNATAAGQDGWRYCKKCAGLFFAGGGTTRCPAGAEHDGSASYAYKLTHLG